MQIPLMRHGRVLLCTSFAFALSGCWDDEYYAAIGRHDEVLACWRSDRTLLPKDCLGREVIAYRRALATDSDIRIAGHIGRVGAETHEGFFRAVQANSDDRFLLDTWALYSPALALQDWLDLHKTGEVPLLPGHSADPAPRFMPNESKATERHTITIAAGKKPDITAAHATLKEFVEANYTSPLFTFFAADSFFKSPLVWLDLDDDGRSEALTIVTTYSEMAQTGCADLLIVSFESNGQIKEREKLATEKRANPCSLGDLGYGGWWSIELIPWPGAKRGAALALESGMDSGDGYGFFVLDDIDPGSAPRVAADFLYVWTFE